MTNLKEIPCPTCAKKQVWDAHNPFRPFCSERCKLIDLGEWAAENYRVAGAPANTNPDEDNEGK